MFSKMKAKYIFRHTKAKMIFHQKASPTRNVERSVSGKRKITADVKI